MVQNTQQLWQSAEKEEIDQVTTTQVKTQQNRSDVMSSASYVGQNVILQKPYDPCFRLLLIGDSGVGKTYIMFRYVDDNFCLPFISTIGK